jgi:hypothetical protein
MKINEIAIFNEQMSLSSFIPHLSSFPQTGAHQSTNNIRRGKPKSKEFLKIIENKCPNRVLGYKTCSAGLLACPPIACGSHWGTGEDAGAT